jgi:hypothetical protein
VILDEVVKPWLEGNLADAVYAGLTDLVHTTEDDLRLISLQIAKHLVVALLRGDKAWTDEIGAQVRVVFEIKKIRLSKREKALIQRTILNLATAVIKAFAAGAAKGLLDGAGGRPGTEDKILGILGI